VAKVTLKTVAERVGVSPMTVSNAFSRPDQLSAALREKILATAAELGYVGPDPAARTLARGTTGTVGILLTESFRYAFSDEFSITFLAALAEELARGGLALTLLPADGAGDVVPARDVAMDAALVYSCSPAVDSIAWLRRRRLPLVTVDQPQEADVTSINVADRDGGRLAAAHLVELGHRRIAVLTVGPEVLADPDDWFVARLRLQGWQDVLQPAGIEPIVERGAVSTQEEGYLAGRRLLAAPQRPTAVLCFADSLAAGVLRAAADAGVRVPEDLSVVGFDDTALARHTRPPLTTVRQDAAGKAAAAAAELVEAVRARRNGTVAPVRHHVLPVELVVRGSTAPPSSAG
jgi:DNA-binding LacI/PurR family transcriptional regulator